MIETTGLSKLREYNQGQGEITPANILVMYRAGDTPGQDIAAYYQAARSIPPGNVYALPTSVLSWTSPGGNNSRISYTDMAAVNSAVAAYVDTMGIEVRAIVLCGHWPFRMLNSIAADYINFDGVLGAFQSFKTAGQTAFASPGGFSDIYYSKAGDAGRAVGPAYSFRAVGQRMSKTCGRYPVFRLEFIEPDASDTTVASPSMAAYAKRMVDDAIAAEESRYRDFGNVILTGSTSYNGLGFAIFERYALKGVSYGTLWAEDSAGDIPLAFNNTGYASAQRAAGSATYVYQNYLQRSGNYIYTMPVTTGGAAATVAPAYSTVTGVITMDGDFPMLCLGPVPSDNFGAGCNTTQQYGSSGNTFVKGAYTDVMYSAVGIRGYIGTGAASYQIQDIDAYGFRKGAIAVCAQSFGATPNPQYAVDMDFGSWNLSQGTTDACTNNATLSATNTLGVSNTFMNIGVNKPVGGFTAASAAGGTLALGTYYYLVTATTGGVESYGAIDSNNGVWVDGASNGTINLGWSAVAGATQYDIYRFTAKTPASSFQHVGSSVTNSFSDTGFTPSARTPPLASITYSAGTLTLFKNGASIGSYTIPAGTYRSAIESVRTWLAANHSDWWATQSNSGGMSRALQAIRGGACVAFGANVEPYAYGMPYSLGITKMLWEGWSVGEIAPMVGNNNSLTFFGDPLYRPFGHRRIPGKGMLG